MSRAIAVVVALVLCEALGARVAAAQNGPAGGDSAAGNTTGANPTAEIERARQAVEQVRVEADCIQTVLAGLEDVVRLLGEAAAQMQSPSTTEAARQDARTAVTSLAQRRAQLLERIAPCRQTYESDTPSRHVVYQAPPPDPAVERVAATQNDATRVMEREIRLTPNVFIVTGEQVDGHGTVDSNSVQNAMRGISGPLERCYDQAVGQGALVRGGIILTFAITAAGQVTSIRTERNTISDGFARCVRAAARSLRVSAPARGGDAVIAYTLSFPGPM
jgi:outer membrane biosynthesis protein TonB